MAIQTGTFTLSGKLGKQVFFNKNGKAFVKDAPNPETYHLSEGSRKSGIEFGTASSAASLINKAFAPIATKVGDVDRIHRLKSLLIKVINTGPAELTGNRQPIDGDIGLLKGFEFNCHCRLSKLLAVSPTIEIDPEDELRIRLPRLDIATDFNITPRADTVVIQFMCASLDFAAGNGRFTRPEDLVLPLKSESFPGGSLILPLEDSDNKVLLVAMGVSFAYEDGVLVKNRDFHAGTIVEAVYIRDGNIVSFQYPEKVVKPVGDGGPGNRIPWIINEEKE